MTKCRHTHNIPVDVYRRAPAWSLHSFGSVLFLQVLKRWKHVNDTPDLDRQISITYRGPTTRTRVIFRQDYTGFSNAVHSTCVQRFRVNCVGNTKIFNGNGKFCFRQNFLHVLVHGWRNDRVYFIRAVRRRRRTCRPKTVRDERTSLEICRFATNSQQCATRDSFVSNTFVPGQQRRVYNWFFTNCIRCLFK